MTGFHVDFLGCKISQTDAEGIAQALVDAGHSPAQAASVRVVNTCCITAEAEKKSRKAVRQQLRSSDEARVFVTGCGATLRPQAYADLGERVTVLPGAALDAASAVVAAADAFAGLGCRGEDSALPRALDRTRGFVKVQDGCDFGCSYCVVPQVRGASRSRAMEAVLADVARRVARGQREIVLTGVNIGLYRDPVTRVGLHTLLPSVADVDGVDRVRVSSIEVNHVNPRLVRAMADHPKICPHLHVPLQSGDDAVLCDMRRHYDTARYARAIERAREAMPHLNLTTDVIVGFPGEDDAAFQRTLSFADRIGFTRVHAFPFSPRPGTERAADDRVDAQTKRARSRALREQADARARRWWAARVGQTDEVLVERGSATLTDEVSHVGSPVSGYTRDYNPVTILDEVDQGELVAVELVGCDDRGLVARRLPAG